MTMLVKVTIFIFFASLAEQATANAFLGRTPEQASSGKASLSFEHALLGELETLLGSEHRTFTERRLSKIEEVVRPIFTAMPKNKHGNLGHAAVSYVLHRLFVQRHAWFIRGLESGGRGEGTWNDTSPVTLFEDKVPEYVQGIFEKRVGESGMGVHEIAVLAATLEHLVHKEALDRLQLAYKVHKYSPEEVMSTSEASEVFDTYMAVYILGFMLKNRTALSAEDAKELRANVPLIYPTWPDTQQFIREVQETLAPNRDYLYFSDTATVIEEAGERYGRWQDLECRSLKKTLLAIEDTGPGGAGRVRLADFYGLALNEGQFQFSESVNYLRIMGNLDESDPKNPRVIITNYVNGPSNCVASSSYYSVCCIDECESLLAQLEQKLAKPDALPREIVAVVSTLLSSSQQAERQLSPWLLQQLDDVAAHHGGVVPLHGRLFSQWMHYAYPRDCPYPHVSGTTEAIGIDVAMTTAGVEGGSAASKDEMQRHVDSVPARMEEILDLSAHEELQMMSMEEELVVHRSLAQDEEKTSSMLSSCLRGAAFVAAIAMSLIGLVNNFKAYGPRHPASLKVDQKYFV